MPGYLERHGLRADAEEFRQLGSGELLLALRQFGERAAPLHLAEVAPDGVDVDVRRRGEFASLEDPADAAEDGRDVRPARLLRLEVLPPVGEVVRQRPLRGVADGEVGLPAVLLQEELA